MQRTPIVAKLKEDQERQQADRRRLDEIYRELTTLSKPDLEIEAQRLGLSAGGTRRLLLELITRHRIDAWREVNYPATVFAPVPIEFFERDDAKLFLLDTTNTFGTVRYISKEPRLSFSRRRLKSRGTIHITYVI